MVICGAATIDSTDDLRMSHFVDHVACTVCACVCDDLRLTVRANRIVQAEGACCLATDWFAEQNAAKPPTATVGGTPVSFESAVAESAKLLRSARAPLIYGLSRSSTDGQRAAVALADRLQGTIDTTASEGHATSLMALQESGESTCSLGEVRHRADLVIFWGSDPVTSHPRHLERYSLYPRGEQIPNGRADRTLVVVDSTETETGRLADMFFLIPPGRDWEALWTLRALLNGFTPAADAATGLPLPALQALAERMKSCRCGVLFFGYGLARQPLGHRVVEAVLRLTIELNRFTRFHARRMRMLGDVAGADNVLCWQTGYPFAVNFHRGYPRYNPDDYTAGKLLSRGECDAAVFIGADRVSDFPPAARAHLQAIPTLLLDNALAEPCWSPTVRFTTAVYGIHHPGTAYRMDDIPIPLRASLTTAYPTDGEALRAIHTAL